MPTYDELIATWGTNTPRKRIHSNQHSQDLCEVLFRFRFPGNSSMQNHPVTPRSPTLLTCCMESNLHQVFHYKEGGRREQKKKKKVRLETEQIESQKKKRELYRAKRKRAHPKQRRKRSTEQTDVQKEEKAAQSKEGLKRKKRVRANVLEKTKLEQSKFFFYEENSLKATI